MEGRLHAFLQAARERVASGAYAATGSRLRPNGSLKRALLEHPAPVIAELKPRSPSEGRLLDRPPEGMLAAFKDGGAAGLSILTDATFFDGSPRSLRSAHATGLPVLMKDFVVDGRQLDAAVHHGASAVLLIERCFAAPQDREALVAQAHRMGLEVLLEVFNDAEWQRAKASAADLVGVNARDLETFTVDARAALALVARIAESRSVVALSGIDDRASYRTARAAGACAALVGTALMRAPDPSLALRSLQRPLAKVCGLKTAADVVHAARSGAELVGFVVGSPGSPRDLPLDVASRLVSDAKRVGVRSVLVTRHKEPDEVRRWCEQAHPDFVQLHGFVPDPEWESSLVGIPTYVLQAVKPGQVPPVAGAGLVVDPSEGSDETVVVREASSTIAQAKGRMTLVAGGLGPNNVANVIVATGAWGADASSGLESSPGRKDPDLVARYVQAVHAA